MLALNNIQGEVCFFTIALLFHKIKTTCWTGGFDFTKCI